MSADSVTQHCDERCLDVARCCVSDTVRHASSDSVTQHHDECFLGVAWCSVSDMVCDT